MNCTLRDLDETDIESLYGLSGYLARKNVGKDGKIKAKPTAPNTSAETMYIGDKAYKRVSADSASWLK